MGYKQYKEEVPKQTFSMFFVGKIGALNSAPALNI